MMLAHPHRTFRDELFAAGVLIPSGVDGVYGRSAAFEEVVEGIDRLVRSAGEDQHATVLRFPPVMPRAVFERTDYLKSFPNLTGSVHTFLGDERAHAELLMHLEDDEDWTNDLGSADLVLSPAACHPVYPTCRGRLDPDGHLFDVYGYCFRREPSCDPMRMQSFRMHEYVFVGDVDAATKHRDMWVDRGLDLLGCLGLDVSAEPANDPFFGRAGRILAAAQRDEVLKLEVVTPIYGEAPPTAIMSANCHRDHFGSAFDIRTASGEVAHSSCVGFGMERIALALFRAHGPDPFRWSTGLLQRLRP